MKTYLKEWMGHKGISVEELAGGTSISAKMIEKYLGGSPTPSLTAMCEISEYLKVSIYSLINVDPYTIDVTKDEPETKIEAEAVTPVAEKEEKICKTYIPEWLVYLGVTPAQIAEKSKKLTELSISKWIAKLANPSIDELKELSKTIEVSLDELINIHPSKMGNLFTDQHLVETRDYITAIRIRKFFTETNIEHECTVLTSEKDAPVFMIRYTSKMIFEPSSLVKISKSRKYRDKDKEKANDEEFKFEGMSVVKL